MASFREIGGYVLDEDSPWFKDPTGFAKKVIGVVTGVVTLVTLVASAVTGGGLDAEALANALVAVVTGVGAILAVGRAQRDAFKPETAASEYRRGYNVAAGEGDPT